MDSVLNKEIVKVCAFAPATSANFAVGFDLIGFAIDDRVGDRVTVVKREDRQIVIKEISGVVDHTKLSCDVNKNVCSAVIIKFLKEQQLDLGVDIYIEKGIPLGSGIGGSAASAAAAIVAINQFLTQPFKHEALADYVIYGESLTSGGSFHGDNAIPSLVGGLVLIQSSKPPCQFIQLPTNNLYASVVCPALSIETKSARTLIKAPFSIETVVENSANLAGVMSALYTQDLKLLKQCLSDVLIEPRRLHLITGFDRIKYQLLQQGAIGCGISGSGPAVFAISDTQEKAQQLTHLIQKGFTEHKLKSVAYVSKLSAPGASIIKIQKR